MIFINQAEVIKSAKVTQKWPASAVDAMGFWFILLPLIGVMIGSLGVGHAMKTGRR